MYNVALSSLIGFVVFGAVSVFLPWWGSLLPALLATGLSLWLLARRINGLLQPELEKVGPLLEARDVKGAEAHLRSVQKRFGRWQLYLDSQIESQLGMIDYLQMKWDQALPKLEKGQWQNAHAQVCVGAIHFRQGRKEKAWEFLAKACETDAKNPMTHIVHTVLRARADQREEALAAISKGLETLPKHGGLKQLKQRVANKKKIDVKQLPQAWYQYFPEDLAKQMVVRGRKGGPIEGQPQAPQPRHGARSAPRR